MLALSACEFVVNLSYIALLNLPFPTFHFFSFWLHLTQSTEGTVLNQGRILTLLLINVVLATAYSLGICDGAFARDWSCFAIFSLNPFAHPAAQSRGLSRFIAFNTVPHSPRDCAGGRRAPVVRLRGDRVSARTDRVSQHIRPHLLSAADHRRRPGAGLGASAFF